MKKILFFSLLFVSSIILVASCGSADLKEKCSCDVKFVHAMLWRRIWAILKVVQCHVQN